MSHQETKQQRYIEQMMLGYVQLKNRQWDDVHTLLAGTGEHAELETASLAEQSSWLWLLGEYTEQAKDRRLAGQHAARMESIVERIAEHWNEPALHWIYQDRAGVYLSQVALHYAALRSAGFMFLSDTALRTSKEMRDRLFTTFMNNIAMTSEQNVNTVQPDIVLATVPFGFFTPGDLALLKGLENIDAAQLTGREAAFFSWYYTECGLSVKAKQLFEQAAAGDSQGEHVQPWLEAARIMLHLSAADDELRFDHMPLGSECPYFQENNERSPRTVLEHDAVTINLQMRGRQLIDQVRLMYAGNELVYNDISMELIAEQESEPYWQATLPPLTHTGIVKYYFIASHGKEQYQSNHYAYNVHRWERLTLAGAGEARADHCTYLYYQIPNRDWFAQLTIHHTEDAGRKYELAWRTNRPGEASDPEATASAAGELRHIDVLLNSDGQPVKVKLSFPMEEHTEWFGMGERFSRLTFRQYELDNYVYNQYKDQGFRTYIPIPLAIGTSGYGVFLDSPLYSIYQFGTDTRELLDIVADTAPGQSQLVWHRLAGEPRDQIRQYASIAGLPKLPPKWAFGPWMSSNNWDSDKETRYQLDQNRKHEIPATVMVLEQWSDEATFYIFNDAQYTPKPGEQRFTYADFTFPAWGRWPDPKGLVERIHDDGLKLLLWQAPVMKYMEGLAHQQHDLDEHTMIEQGYMVKQADGSPYRIPSFEWFRGSLVPDFTGEEASEWWLSKRRYLLDELHIDGFKTDGGECIYGSDVQFHDGRTGAEMRNAYPNTYVRAFHDYANRFTAGGAITFSRAGYTGAQRTPMHWAGDEKSTFEAFRSTIIAGLSSGLSGIPFWGWDMGGFSGEIPTAELYIRSTQMAAFCPVMQYHAESKGQYNMDRTPWNIAERTNTPEVLSVYKRYADLRMNLLPYIYEQAQHSAATGEPLMRALLVDYSDDPIARIIDTQYMFGKALLVAPVAEEGAADVNMYFPRGRWTSLFDDQAPHVIGGAYKQIDAALADIPVYLQENCFIPLNLSHELNLATHIGNQVDEYARLAILAYITGDTAYQFVDLPHASVKLRVEQSSRVTQLIAEVEGELAPVLWLKQAAAYTELTCNGQPLREAASVGELAPLGCLRRGNDLLLHLQPGRQVIRWIN